MKQSFILFSLLLSCVYSQLAFGGETIDSSTGENKPEEVCITIDKGKECLSNQDVVSMLPNLIAINYADYNANDYNINWQIDNEKTTNIFFKLYEQKIYLQALELKSVVQPWELVYSGIGFSHNVVNQNPGNYHYKVKVCSTVAVNYCSEFMLGNTTEVVNYADADINLLYPGLGSFNDAQIAAMSDWPRFYDVTNGQSQNGPVIQSGSSGVIAVNPDKFMPPPPELSLNLGRGYLKTSGEYTGALETCLNLESAYTTEILNGEETMDVTIADTTENLADLLDLDTSANLSLSDVFEGGGKYEFFRETTSNRRNQNIVVNWEKNAKSLNLFSNTSNNIAPKFWDENYIDPLESEPVQNNPMLNPVNPDTTGEMTFRSICGDKYVQSVDVGARLYVVATIQDTELSDETIETIAAQVELHLNNIAVEGDLTQLTTAEAYFNSHNVDMHIFTEGGNPDDESTFQISSLVNLSELYPAIEAFRNSIEPDYYVAVDKTLVPYTVPDLFAIDYAYFDVFINYNPYLEQVNRWLNLDYQAYARCTDLENSNAPFGTDCDTAEFYLANNIGYCAFGELWNQCVHPNTVQMTDGVFLLNFLNSNIHDYRSVASMQNSTSYVPYFAEHEGGLEGVQSDTSMDNFGLIRACLPSNACIVNSAIQSTASSFLSNFGISAPLGVSITVDEIATWGGAGSTFQFLSINAEGALCLDTNINICTEGVPLESSLAKYQGSQTIHGLCPVPNDFTVL